MNGRGLRRHVCVLWLIATACVCAVFGLAAQGPRLNPMIAKLASGEPAVGGVDWLWIEMEDSPLALDRLPALLDQFAGAPVDGRFKIAPLVRIPQEGDEDSRWVVKQVLDRGALGVVFSHIDTAAQALKAVHAMRYPAQRGAAHPLPAGRRAWFPADAAAFWKMPVAEYARRADVWPLNPEGELIAMMMVETAESVENIEEILAVPGVAAAFVGPNDLGVSLGVGPATPRNAPETEAAIERVAAACRKRRAFCGYPGAVGGKSDKERISQGFSIIGGGSVRPPRL